MNLLSFATALVTVADKAVTAVKDAKLVFTYAAQVMQAAETAWADAGAVAGATKKAQVMAAAEAFASTLNADWSLIEAALAAWIDVTIAGYNAIAAVTGAPSVDSAKVDAVVAQGEQVAQTLVSGAAAIASGANTQGV